MVGNSLHASSEHLPLFLQTASPLVLNAAHLSCTFDSLNLTWFNYISCANQCFHSGSVNWDTAVMPAFIWFSCFLSSLGFKVPTPSPPCHRHVYCISTGTKQVPCPLNELLPQPFPTCLKVKSPKRFHLCQFDSFSTRHLKAFFCHVVTAADSGYIYEEKN